MLSNLLFSPCLPCKLLFNSHPEREKEMNIKAHIKGLREAGRQRNSSVCKDRSRV